MMHRIVMVCSGNICRSPMAQVMAERLLAEAKKDALVISAGTLGIQGQPAAEGAIRAIEAWGATLEHHRSQGVSKPLMTAADHIVVMSPSHEGFLLKRDPNLVDKIVRLWRYGQPAGRLEEIADPVGLDDAAFVRCREDLEQCLRAWIATLK